VRGAYERIAGVLQRALYGTDWRWAGDGCTMARLRLQRTLVQRVSATLLRCPARGHRWSSEEAGECTAATRSNGCGPAPLCWSLCCSVGAGSTWASPAAADRVVGDPLRSISSTHCAPRLKPPDGHSWNTPADNVVSLELPASSFARCCVSCYGVNGLVTLGGAADASTRKQQRVRSARNTGDTVERHASRRHRAK
jgi:hypothetical protein